MTTEQKEKLILVFTNLQCTLFAIDELKEDVKLCFHKVKHFSSALSDEIIKVHGDNIKTVWNVEGGEETMTALLTIYGELYKEISTLSINECGQLLAVIKAYKNGDVIEQKEVPLQP